jgi:hypothetical protein
MPNEFIARNGITSLGNVVVTGSLTATGTINMSGSIASASFATTAATASSADNFLTRGTLTAQTLVVQTITSSVDFVTGSTRFGSISENTHQFTGSVNITGSTNLAGSLKANKIGINVGDLNLNNFTTFGLIVSGSIGFGNSGGAAVLVDRDGSGNTTFYGGIGDIKFSDITLTSNYLTIKNAGNVGIGTADPGHKLDVNGTGRFTGALTGSSATFSGNLLVGPTTSGFDSVSQIASSSTGNIISALTLQNTSLTETAGTGVNLNFGGRLNWLGRISTQFVGTTGGGDASMSFSTPSGGNLGVRLTIASTGAATFSSTIRSDATNGLALGSVAGYRRLQYDLASTTFGFLTDTNSVANIDAGSATFNNNVTIISPSSSANVGTTGQLRISSSTGVTSPASDVYLQAVVDSATPGDRGTAFVVQTGRTSGIAERFRIASNGNTNIGGDLALTPTNSALIFSSGFARIFMGSTETIRITSGGFFKASNTGTYNDATGTYHEFRGNVANNISLLISNTSATSPYGMLLKYTATPNNSADFFIEAIDSTAQRFAFRSNGGLANYQANDANLSDERTKKDIIPLESYWDKFKAIEIVKFKYKDQTHDDFNIGVIAQQVEKVAPEFVDVEGWDNKPKLDEDGNIITNNEEPLKSIYTADLHHATIKVLQEAMAKIEELTARVQELENK